MQEQKELWRVKEKYILQDLSRIYREYDISHILQDCQGIQDFYRVTKEKYEIINLKTGVLLTKKENKKTYQFGFDGARLLELTRDQHGKYKAAPNNVFLNELVLVSDETQILNDLKLYNSIKNIDISKTTDLKVYLMQGVPGCGKTTFILNNYLPGDLVLFPTRDSAQDFRTRFHKHNPNQNKTTSKDYFRTLHSFLINSSHHIQQGNSYKRVIIDEALMMHAGEILFAANCAGAQEIMLIGDINQIPYINRMGDLEVNFYKISELAEIKQQLNISYRCTLSTTALLSPYYSQGMMTTNCVENDLKLKNFISLDDLNKVIDKNRHTCLVFKQSEKRELSKLGYTTATIHEYQGRQAEDIVVVRTTSNLDNIYNSIPHCLVGISRHTKSFLYITPTRDDTISKWIQHSNSLDSQELSKFAVNTIPKTQSITLDSTAADSSSIGNNKTEIENIANPQTQNFLAKRRPPKEIHKEHTTQKSVTFWNSFLKKL